MKRIEVKDPPAPIDILKKNKYEKTYQIRSIGITTCKQNTKGLFNHKIVHSKNY